MESALIILGNQLFPISEIVKTKPQHVFMAEDLGLCTHFKYHKHKIIFFLSSMRSYRDELEDEKIEVTYFDSSHKLFEDSYESKLTDFIEKNKDLTKLQFYEIEDKFFEERLTKYCFEKGIEIEVLKSPMFLTSREDFEAYLKKSKKPFMKTFYESQRKSFDILLDKNKKPIGGKWSFDAENRKKLPKDLSPPPILRAKLTEHSENVIKFVDQEFSDHPGESSDFWLPTTRKESLKWLKHFIDEKLNLYGDYQDAITADSDFVYHSVLSPMINIGFILPSELVKKAEETYRSNPKQVSLNSVEGFIRQVLGWREFLRGIYQNYSEEQSEKNFWNNKRKLKKCWYDGTTGIPVLDDAIKKASKYSYTHHIERLMILSNFMLLCDIDPKEVYKWFMEMHSDSSDWVMGPNVYGMGQFSDGGIFATKPYTCGSNYFLKMSRYKKGNWCDAADGLYWRFIDKHQDFYSSNPRMSFMLSTLERMNEERKTKIFDAADSFINKVSTAK
jgi:deoxyribodipyrimidine photolyase-related protein